MIFTLNTIITFGKYSHEELSLEELIEHDPDYVQWMLDTFSEPFDEEVQAYLDEYIGGLEIAPFESDIDLEPDDVPLDIISILKAKLNELDDKK